MTETKKPFAPRPRRRSQVCGFSLYPEHLKKLDDLVRETGMTRSALIQQMIMHVHYDFTGTRETET